MLVLLAAVVTGAMAQTTYKVSVKEGTEDATSWTIAPAEATTTGVAAGTEVKATYGGTKKVKSVKAKKKAAALSITSPSVGQVIGSDGKNYAAASVPSGVTKVAMIAYVSGSNGLAIALADEGSLNWATAKSTCEAKTPAFTGGTWHLPSQAEWNQMFSANGDDEGSYTGLNTAITTAGGTVLQVPYGYWSSTPDGTQAYYVYLDANKTDWRKKPANLACPVRACLAFTVEQAKPAAMPTLTLGEMTQGGDPLNNGSGSETYFSPTFSEGQQVAVFYKNTSGQTVKVLSDALTASDISNEGKSATINVTIDDADKTQPVTYFYPATMAKDDGSINFNFTAQSGTEASLSTVRNCCKGSGAWDGNALPSVSMASQIAIWKLTMTHVSGMIAAQKVTVKVGGNKVAEASASGTYFAYPIDIYLALNPATMGTGTLRIEADEFGTIYYYQKDGGVSLTAGKFYQSAVELKR